MGNEKKNMLRLYKDSVKAKKIYQGSKKDLLRLYSGSNKALIRLYQGSIKALLRLY